ncbi:MAG: hypothetical protein O2894_09490 [Planctomycetota bacterium]|nr:hypothetical protein [Planctomycetota bacterium]
MRGIVLTLIASLLFVSGSPGARTAAADESAGVRRDFRDDMKAEEWKVRRGAFLRLLDFDGEAVFDECLSATLSEKNAAVILAGIATLGKFESEAAQLALLRELGRAKGERASVLLMALAEQNGHRGVPEMIALLSDKDATKAALAALALGAKRAPDATDGLLASLGHKEWQVRSAAARAFKAWAWTDLTTPDKKSGKLPEPKMADWFPLDRIQKALADALESAEGAPRGDIIEALEFIARKTYGDNLAAWQAHARGEEVTKAIESQRVWPPHFFGVPIWGQRVVIVMDSNVLTDRAHPFNDRDRLQALCDNPGRAGLPWHKIQSVKHFNDAWVRRFLMDLPSSGMSFDLIFSGLKPRPVFGRLKPVNGGTQKSAIEEVEKAGVENENDILSAMTLALDISGRKESVAWTKGPDVVCCVYSSVPWLAEETDAEVVGSTIGLMARRRLVKIQAVGVHEFAYAMMKLFAEQSGGHYRELIH